MVEFVLILPVMMLILLIVADFGRFFSAYISDVNAAREGANYAAAQAADSAYTTIAFNQGIVDAATGQSNAQGQSGGGALDVSSKCFSPSAPSTPIDCHVASDYAGGIGNQVTVTVKQPFAFLTPFIGSLFGGSLTLTTSATAPIFNPKVASVTSTSLTITANNQTRVFDAANPAFTYVVSPSVSLTTPATCSSTATASSPVGTYSITCSGAVLAGYSISYVAGTLTITAAPMTITADNKTRAFGATNPAFTYVLSPSVSLTTPATCTSTADASSPVGNYLISCSGAVLAGYSISYVAGTLTVTSTSTSLIITADNKTRASGAANPAFTYVVSPSVSLTTPATCTATASSTAGTYPITCSGAVLAGYSIGYVAGTLTVTSSTCVTPVVTLEAAPKTGDNKQFSITPTFTATVTNGTVTSWQWDFGDALTSTGASPVTHPYVYTLGYGNGGHGVGLQPWTAKLTVTTLPGCTGSKSVLITLDP